jgi:L-ascorbate metabolism protein UlaG (beta-lactamase superfamily)
MRAQDTVYLSEDVRAEPLVNGFRAWPHLIAPHTYACNVISKHISSLRRALDGAARGQDKAQAEDAQDRIEAILARRPQLAQLGEAIAALDSLMLGEAHGLSLSPVYERVPQPLRGYVELLYDRYNTPSVRFLESALYRSPYYDPTLHEVRLVRVDPDVPGQGISVPRLAEPDQIIIPAPFDSGVWDVLGRARRVPARAGEIAGRLGVTLRDLRPYLTTRPPGRKQMPQAARTRAWFLNHASVLVRSGQASVLFDPLVAYRRHGTADRFSFADLPGRLDLLAITHAHLDHFDIETLLQIRHLTSQVAVPRTGAGDLVDPSLKLMLEAIGFGDVIELDDLTSHPLPGGSLLSVPFFGEHADLTVRGKSGYGITLEGRTCVLAADSQCLEPKVYELARGQLGEVAALFIGMECEGSPMMTATRPYLPPGLHTETMSQSRRTKASDASGGLALVRALAPRRAYVYAMGLEPWLSYMFGVPDQAKSYSLAQTETFIAECIALGVPAELLQHPQGLDLSYN